MDIVNIITHGYYYEDTVVFVLHREDGPADDVKQWFFHGKNVTFHVEEWLTERNYDYGFTCHKP